MPKSGAPNYDAPPLPAASAASGNELPPERKSFSDFLVFFLEIKFSRKKCAVFWEIFQKLFFSGKNPTLSFKKVGILVQIPFGKSTLF